ncbi:MAG: cobalamin biosynthesis protein CobD [Kiritimatiellaeota bacterium]|nr:cobalamin biosynthesis protein CobD [Kiritimatiellota bacterium]
MEFWLGIKRDDWMTAIQIMTAFLLLDLLFGDPVYFWHPIRLYGHLISLFEKILRSVGLDGGFGGFLLVPLVLVCAGTAAIGARELLIHYNHSIFADLWYVFIGYTHIAVRDLLSHGRKVAAAIANDNLPDARKAVSMMVGRDVERLDLNGCGRAAAESLAENLTDGIIAPLLFYAAFGIPGMVFFKVVSTMDSMVGYKNAKYADFGWFAARLDDVLNFIPARLSAPLIAVSAIFAPKCSFANTLKTAWKYHEKTSSPNSGWSEAAMAGALGRRLGGPCWYDGEPGKSEWIGDKDAPADISEKEIARTSIIIVLSATQAAILAAAVIWSIRFW